MISEILRNPYGSRTSQTSPGFSRVGFFVLFGGGCWMVDCRWGPTFWFFKSDKNWAASSLWVGGNDILFGLSLGEIFLFTHISEPLMVNTIFPIFLKFDREEVK